MKQNTTREATSSSRSLALTAVIAALYAVISLAFAPLTFSQVQVRFAEGFNHLVIFNRRYIAALVLGVFITNLFSPLGWVDWVFGTLQTLIMTTMIYYATRHVTNRWYRYGIAILITTAMMWMVALELVLVAEKPLAFWPTYLTTAIGEFLAMTIGVVWIEISTRFIDWQKGRIIHH